MEQVGEEKLNIVCFSNQMWDFELWTNKRHVMYRLAERGHRVLFVDPPMNLGRVFLRQLRKGNWPLKRLLTWIKKDPSGANVFSPLNFDPFFIITPFLNVLLIKILSSIFFKQDRKTILWVYHVQLRNLPIYIKKIKHDVLVYDCVDNYEAFPEEKAFFRTSVFGKDLKVQEEFLAKKANVIFATAPGLVEKLKKYNAKVFFTPNVGDYNRFKDAKKFKDQLPPELASVPRPRVGFTGSLDAYKVDIPLIKKLADDHPKYSFVLIGPSGIKDRDIIPSNFGLDRPNIYFLGRVPFENLYRYYAGFDVYIIPYVLNDYTVGGCFPVKFHEALASGVPVVVTNLPAYAPFSDVCYISKNHEDFSENVRKALEEDSIEKVRKRQDVARENDYDGKIDKMLSLIFGELGK